MPLEAAWRNVGRVHELGHFHPEAQWITVALGPDRGPVGRAFDRACEVMQSEGLNLVDPTEPAISAALAGFGLVDGPEAAEVR